MSLSYKVLSELALLTAFALLLLSRGRHGAPTRGYLTALALLACASLAPHVELLRTHVNGQVHVHPTEFYHYYLGSKYFRECGYYGLYEAAVVAESELAPAAFRPAETIRHLRNPDFEMRKADVLRNAAAIEQRFRPARWQSFKDDLAFFRSFDLRRWGSSPPERDHGYNGTPLTTALLGFLANHGPEPASRFVPLAAWLDLSLIAALALVFGRMLGWEAAWAFLLLWALNPLNDFAFTGGAYLRHAYFAALALGIALFARRKLAAGAGALATSAGFQIFPAVFIAAIAAHDLVNAGLRERLREHGRFYAGLAVALLALGLLTASVRGPEGGAGWVRFFERIARHSENLSPNRIGLPYLLSYSADHELADLGSGEPRRTALDWRRDMRETLAARRPVYLALLALGLAASLVFLRSVPAAEAPFIGLLWLFLLAMPSHYYYGVLGIVPIVFPSDRRVWLLFAALSVVLLALESTDWIMHSQDLAYAAYSAAVGVFLIAVTLLKSDASRGPWRRRSSSPPAARARADAAPQARCV